MRCHRPRDIALRICVLELRGWFQPAIGLTLRARLLSMAPARGRAKAPAAGRGGRGGGNFPQRGCLMKLGAKLVAAKAKAQAQAAQATSKSKGAVATGTLTAEDFGEAYEAGAEGPFEALGQKCKASSTLKLRRRSGRGGTTRRMRGQSWAMMRRRRKTR